MLEINGNCLEGVKAVGALGGYLGQFMLTLAIIEKNYNRSLTAKSGKSKKSTKSNKSNSKGKDLKDEKKEQDDASKLSKRSKNEDESKSGLGDLSKTDREIVDGADVQAQIQEPVEVIAGLVGGPSVAPVANEKGWFTK